MEWTASSRSKVQLLPPAPRLVELLARLGYRAFLNDLPKNRPRRIPLRIEKGNKRFGAILIN